MTTVRKGDTLRLRPVTVVDNLGDDFYKVFLGSKDVTVATGDVEEIVEQPIRAGDAVLDAGSNRFAAVIAIDGALAWLRGENEARWIADMERLERRDGMPPK